MSPKNGTHSKGTRFLQGLSVAGVVAFLGVLAWYLGQPGYTRSRLALFAALGICAVAGAAGVVFERQVVSGIAVCGLVVLGLFQAVLWVYILPVGALLLVAAVGTAVRERSNPSATG